MNRSRFGLVSDLLMQDSGGLGVRRIEHLESVPKLTGYSRLPKCFSFRGRVDLVPSG